MRSRPQLYDVAARVAMAQVCSDPDAYGQLTAGLTTNDEWLAVIEYFVAAAVQLMEDALPQGSTPEQVSAFVDELGDLMLSDTSARGAGDDSLQFDRDQVHRVLRSAYGEDVRLEDISTTQTLLILMLALFYSKGAQHLPHVELDAFFARVWTVLDDEGSDDLQVRPRIGVPPSGWADYGRADVMLRSLMHTRMDEVVREWDDMQDAGLPRYLDRFEQAVCRRLLKRRLPVPTPARIEEYAQWLDRSVVASRQMFPEVWRELPELADSLEVLRDVISHALADPGPIEETGEHRHAFWWLVINDIARSEGLNEGQIDQVLYRARLDVAAENARRLQEVRWWEIERMLRGNVEHRGDLVLAAAMASASHRWQRNIYVMPDGDDSVAFARLDDRSRSFPPSIRLSWKDGTTTIRRWDDDRLVSTYNFTPDEVDKLDGALDGELEELVLPTLICVRCGEPVIEAADSYKDIFERMHYVCFHYEYEHWGTDPDIDCKVPGCVVAGHEPRKKALADSPGSPDV